MGMGFHSIFVFLRASPSLERKESLFWRWLDPKRRADAAKVLPGEPKREGHGEEHGTAVRGRSGWARKASWRRWDGRASPIPDDAILSWHVVESNCGGVQRSGGGESAQIGSDDAVVARSAGESACVSSLVRPCRCS